MEATTPERDPADDAARAAQAPAVAPGALVSELPDDVRITDELLIHIAAQGAPLPARKRLPLPRLPRDRRAWFEISAVAAAFVIVLAAIWQALHAPLFAPEFGASGLVTNENASKHPGPGAKQSDDWLVTSGSLLARDGWGWTGVPDGNSPDGHSATATDSAVFRAVSRRKDLQDVEVSFDLRNLRIIETPRTPVHNWDGVNIMLRWRSHAQTYYVGINRRDGHMVVKKKVAGGTVNGGWYYPLTATQDYHVPFGKVQRFRATVTNDPDGAVTIKVYVDGRLKLHANDAGVGGPPITEPGRVGLRGDNDEFLFRNFVVRRSSSEENGHGPTPQAASDRAILRKDRPDPTL